ncbi:MAG TPA: hypothetical protein PKE39_04335 [Ignavibacteria bacterium]|nr:hypothetical protein [Ignavibacteria bacterium]
MITENIEHKAVTHYESIQVIAPYEIFKVTNAITHDVLWFEVRALKDNAAGITMSPRPFLKESEARDYIIQQITDKHHNVN